MSQVSVAQQDFTFGISKDAAPHEVDARAVLDHINGLYDKNGSVFKRGGSANLSTSALGSAGLTFLWDGYFDAGQRTVYANASDFAVLDASEGPVNLGSDGLPYPKPAALMESMLFIGGGYIYAGSRKTAAYSTGTITATNGSKTVTGSGTTWSTLVDAGMLMQVGNERVYAIASIDSTTQVTLRDAYEGTTGSGKSYAFNPLYKITAADPYPDSEFYSVCANRLVYSTDGKTLGFSEILDPDDQTADIDGTPVANEHPVPEGRILATATVGLTTLIFTTAGMWALEGLAFDIVDPQGNPQHRLQLASRETSIWAPAGIAFWNQAAIVPALDGIYLMDGVRQPTRISHGIDNLYRHYITQGYRGGQAAVYRGHYFLPILNATGTEIRDVLVSRLDRPVRSDGQVAFPWSRLRGAGACAAYAVRSIADDEPHLLGAELQASSRVVDCSAFFEPDQTHASDADGSAFSWVLVTRDYETGNLTTNKVRRIRARYELVPASADSLTESFNWNFDSSTTAADPGSGDFRANTAALDSISEFYVSQTDAVTGDRGVALGIIDPHAIITLTAQGLDFTYEVVGAPVDHGTWWTIPVLHLTSAFAGLSLTTSPYPIGFAVEQADEVADAPSIRFAYGFGRKEEGGYTWDAYNWDDLDTDDDDDDLVWETEDDETFHPLPCIAPYDSGANPFRCRVNKDARYMRFRLSQDEPCAVMRLRSFEVFVRPSQAERR